MPQRAGFWIRTLAALIDLLVFLILLVAMTVVVAFGKGLNDPRSSQMINVALVALWLIYTTLEIWTSATLGKLALGLRIASQDGTFADPWRKTLRWSTKQLSIIAAMLYVTTSQPVMYALCGFMNLIVVVGCFFAANDDHLAWHDQWSHTCVCWRRTMMATAPPALPPSPAA